MDQVEGFFSNHPKESFHNISLKAAYFGFSPRTPGNRPGWWPAGSHSFRPILNKYPGQQSIPDEWN